MHPGIPRAYARTNDLGEEIDIVLRLARHLLTYLQQHFLKLRSRIHQNPPSCTRNSGVTIDGEKNPAAALNILSLACLRTFAMCPKFQVTT